MAKPLPITKYRAKSDDGFPFHKIQKDNKNQKMKGPSGSTWDRVHLNWLGVDHQRGYDLEDIAPEDQRLAFKIIQHIDNSLNMTLTQTQSAETDNLNAFYVDLRNLLSDDPKPAVYDKSSTYDGSSQPREAYTSSPSSNRPRLMTESPSAAHPSELLRIPKAQNLSPSSDKGHRMDSLSPPSSPPFISHLNYIDEPQMPTQNRGMYIFGSHLP